MISVFELFKIGIGPSSSHTVGPMKAAGAFAAGLETERVARVKVTLFGSLAFTGKGHATDRAIILGLAGQIPETVDSDRAEALLADAATRRRLPLAGRKDIAFDPQVDIVFDFVSTPPRHPNTMSFAAFDANGGLVSEETWLSVGGGFIVRDARRGGHRSGGLSSSIQRRRRSRPARRGAASPSPKSSMRTRLLSGRGASSRLDAVIEAMFACIDRGLREGELPGGFRVRRRAKALLDRCRRCALQRARGARDHGLGRVFAIAVNEENAAGGRVVTAPTNGAAGVVPAVLRYYRDLSGGVGGGAADVPADGGGDRRAVQEERVDLRRRSRLPGRGRRRLSMAAAGLAAALGGSNAQIENAAEIGMEHHLGMTCDPIGGLVQIPCIERNAFGAVKAINAASLALHGDGSAQGLARSGDRDDASDRRRHADEIQGNFARRPGGEFRRVLKGGGDPKGNCGLRRPRSPQCDKARERDDGAHEDDRLETDRTGHPCLPFFTKLRASPGFPPGWQ